MPPAHHGESPKTGGLGRMYFLFVRNSIAHFTHRQALPCLFILSECSETACVTGHRWNTLRLAVAATKWRRLIENLLLCNSPLSHQGLTAGSYILSGGLRLQQAFRLLVASRSSSPLFHVFSPLASSPLFPKLFTAFFLPYRAHPDKPACAGSPGKHSLSAKKKIDSNNWKTKNCRPYEIVSGPTHG